MEEKALIKELARLRSESSSTGGPLVSIVITNRDGEDHLRRLFQGLARSTRYENFEVVLVDNGSTDRSLDLFEKWPGRKRLVANQINQSFSAANNQGVRAASGVLVLLANNDIEPIHPDWLGYMVESLDEGVAAVGAMLIYPARRRRRDNPPAFPDFTVQHLGVGFEHSRWGVRAANIGAGTDPKTVTQPTRREVPAITAACLLARRSDLLVNPLDESYWYGSEDWDLCLRLGNTGKILIDERAVLFHHEYGTQDRFMDSTWLEGRTRNHQRFNDFWGPALMREIRRETTAGETTWFYRGYQAPTVSVTSGNDATTMDLGERLRHQAAEAGWLVSDAESQPGDLALALAPPENVERFARLDLSIALVVNRAEEWSQTGALDAAKKVVVPDRAGKARLDALWGSDVAQVEEGLGMPTPDAFARLLERAAPRPSAMRIGVSTCAPDWARAQFWGDTHMARGLMRAFRRLGHEATELIMSDWRGMSASSCDVVVHLRGLTRRPVAVGQWNLLWVISHPDRLEPGECDDYDLIASASHRHADELSEKLGREVHFIPQATDADTFKNRPLDIDFETSVLYVGNARWPNRRAPRWMMRNGRHFDLYGKNWDKFPEALFVRDEYIANRDLSAAYRSAAVVVADHHGSMRTNGFIANRLFDVLASGGVVLSDDVTGLPELFGDLIPTYTNAKELESHLRVLLADASLRRQLSTKGRGLVLADHTLDHRARTWLELLDKL